MKTFDLWQIFVYFDVLKGIVKCAEPGKCDILLVSRILWHKRIIPSLKEWRFSYLILTGEVYAAQFPRRLLIFIGKNLWCRVLEDRRFCVCIFMSIYQIIKNRGPGPYNSLCHADNRKYFSGLSLMRNRGEAYMFYLGREVGKIWRCSCWKKGNFIMLIMTIWPSPLSLSLYSTFKLL